jgi:large subunit ribosomal protein L22
METTVKLSNCAHSPRKMRLLADLVRGMKVDKAIYVLKVHEKKMYALHLEKLIRSAVASWSEKNTSGRVDENELIVKSVKVDAGRVLKRIQPAPQGRAHRVRKRYNHITVVVSDSNDSLIENEKTVGKTEQKTTRKTTKLAKANK